MDKWICNNNEKDIGKGKLAYVVHGRMVGAV